MNETIELAGEVCAAQDKKTKGIPDAGKTASWVLGAMCDLGMWEGYAKR